MHYFDTQYRRGESWYRASFPHRLEHAMREKILKSPTVTGEATPYYLYHPHAPQRIASDLPEAKLMVLLRNPTERALSHYHHTRRRALESLSFEDALETEPERLGPELARMREDPFYNSDPHRIFSYLDRGIYVDQLQRYAEHFPRRQISCCRASNSSVTLKPPSTGFLSFSIWTPGRFQTQPLCGWRGIHVSDPKYTTGWTRDSAPTTRDSLTFSMRSSIGDTVPSRRGGAENVSRRVEASVRNTAEGAAGFP